MCEIPLFWLLTPESRVAKSGGAFRYQIWARLKISLQPQGIVKFLWSRSYRIIIAVSPGVYEVVLKGGGELSMRSKFCFKEFSLASLEMSWLNLRSWKSCTYVGFSNQYFTVDLKEMACNKNWNTFVKFTFSCLEPPPPHSNFPLKLNGFILSVYSFFLWEAALQSARKFSKILIFLTHRDQFYCQKYFKITVFCFFESLRSKVNISEKNMSYMFIRYPT